MGRYRIGFDFGTSTTKVCYYELDREEFGLFKWSGNMTDLWLVLKTAL